MAGQILLEEPKAHRSILKQGDRDLAREREKLFLEMIGSIAAIGAMTTGFSEDIAGQIHEGLLVQSEIRLSLRAATKLHTVAAQDFRLLIGDIDAVIRDGVAKAVVKSSNIQNGFLQRSGIPPISTEQIEKIQKKVLRMMSQEFPKGSGMTYQQRLERIYQGHSHQMKMVLRRSHVRSKVVTNIMRDIRTGIAHTDITRTPIAGGSAAKKLQRLMVAEESRLANEVERRVIQASGIKFGYWRLSPVHQWYGGSEICEVLADGEDPITAALLAKSGKGLSSVPLRGLYPLSRWPSYPHPYCKCYMEPLI